MGTVTERHCLHCGNSYQGRSDKIFCCDDCRTDYHNEVRRRREKQLRETNRILSSNWRILSAFIKEGRRELNVAELASRNFNFQIYTGSRGFFPMWRTYWCYNLSYRISKTGKVRIYL